VKWVFYIKAPNSEFSVVRECHREEKMKKKMNTMAFLAFAGITALSVEAQADIAIFSGLEGGSGGMQHVLFNYSDSNGAALPVYGYLNQTNQIVKFTGTDLLSNPSGEKAGISPADDTIAFQLAEPAKGFDKVQFNVDARDDGYMSLVFTDQNGVDWPKMVTLNGSGQNFFTAIAGKGQYITSVTLDYLGQPGGFADLAQVRLNPVGLAVVPEPGTMALVGLGMACLGFLGARRQNK
jgi:hypothetical protein